MNTGTRGSYLAIACAAAVVVVLVVWRPAAVEAVYPIERAGQAISRSVWPRIAGFFRGSAARAENVRLKREVASLAVLRGDIERLEAENVRLRRALGYSDKAAGEWLAAEVLSSGGGAACAGDRIRVGKGLLAGVERGAVVVVPEGLVGRVASVTPHTAEVALVTDASVKAACEVEVQSGAPLRGILTGGGDFLVLSHLSGKADPPPRARVITSGGGGVFPRGIEVGSLLCVRQEDGSLSRTGEVLPSVDFTTLEDVFIRRAK